MSDDEPSPINDRVATPRWAAKLLRDIADQIERSDDDTLDEVVQRFPFTEIEKVAALVFRGQDRT